MTTPRARLLRRSVSLPAHSFLLLLIVLVGITPPFLQSWAGLSGDKKPVQPYALIYGTVYGPDDRPVYGAKVKIRRANEKKARWELYSDHSGEFAQRVPPGPGDYVIWVDLKGFKSQSGKKLEAGKEVTLHIDNEERADISLHLK